jgi:hypothetical protein
MDKNSPEENARKRQALLESKYSKQELKELREFDATLNHSDILIVVSTESERKKLNNSNSPQSMIGYVYILKNPFIPGLVKIGYTDRDPIVRSRELSSFTGVPGNFEIVISWRVLNANSVEKMIHAKLSKLNKSGEFFEIDPEVALVTVKKLLIGWGIVGEDGLSYEEHKLLKINKEKQERKQLYKAKIELGKNLRHAVDAVYSELMTTSLESFRLADEQLKPKGILSFFKPQNYDLREKLVKDIFNKKKNDLAVRLNMNWITGDPAVLPFIYKNDFHVQVARRNIKNYCIPAGTTVSTSEDWVRNNNQLFNVLTNEKISYDFMDYNLVYKWNTNSCTPFYFTIIAKNFLIIVGEIKDDKNR